MDLEENQISESQKIFVSENFKIRKMVHAPDNILSTKILISNACIARV